MQCLPGRATLRGSRSKPPSLDFALGAGAAAAAGAGLDAAPRPLNSRFTGAEAGVSSLWKSCRRDAGAGPQPSSDGMSDRKSVV